ncbi:hypothetical protein CCYA_CCYA05G1664 [Cyanidiococcus yangmingshanensis]|nr:hypothetical protein CCYA_CCYA05G1664 [Cyanidiococcus yangmingshanensis]
MRSFLETVAESVWAIEALRLQDAFEISTVAIETGQGEQVPSTLTRVPSERRHALVQQLLGELRTEFEQSVHALEQDWLGPAAQVHDAVGTASQAFQRLQAGTKESLIGRMLLSQELNPAVHRLLRTYALAKQANVYLERLGVLAEEAEAVDRALEGGETDLQLVWGAWKRLHEEEELLSEELAFECQLIASDSNLLDSNVTDGERLRAILADRCGRRLGLRIQNECRHRLRDLVPVAEQRQEDIKQMAVIMREEPSLLAPLFPAIIREAVSRRAQQHERAMILASTTNPVSDPGGEAMSSTNPTNDWIREALAGFEAVGAPDSVHDRNKTDGGSANELPVMDAMPIQRTEDANTQFSPAESIETSEEPEVEPQLVTRVQALCDLLVADVQFVAEHVRPLFDENTAVGHWYALETNQLLNAFLWSIIARASLIPGKDILNLLMWITKYHERIRQLFPAPSTDSLSWNGAVVWAREQQEALLHGLETPARRLIEGYAARALEMMRRWIRNCIKVDIEGPVDVRDEDETLYTQAPLDVFRIVNDEMTIVREHAQLRNPRFVQCISDACCAALLDYRTWSLDALEGIESEDGALERFCATVNNHRRCQSLAEQFAIRCHTILDEIVYGLVDWRRESSSTPTTTDATLETPMTKQDAPGSSHPLGGAIDAATYALSVDRLAAEFAVSAEFAATLVCNVIFQDMDEAPGLWPRLYTPAWVLGEEEIASSVVATVDDFFQDIDGYLRHEMDKAAVATECAIRIADRYASALANHLLATSAVVSPTLSTQADGDPSDSACAPSTKAKSRSNIAQRITGGGSSRLLRALGTSRDGNLSGRLGNVANPLAFDRRIVDRLRDDYAILAEHFLHARRGGSRARVARALSAMDALADMLAAAVAANTDALVTSYGNLLDAKLSRAAQQLWQPNTVERLLGSLTAAAERHASLEVWRDALVACRRVWCAREQIPWEEESVP